MITGHFSIVVRLWVVELDREDTRQRDEILSKILLHLLHIINREVKNKIKEAIWRYEDPNNSLVKLFL